MGQNCAFEPGPFGRLGTWRKVNTCVHLMPRAHAVPGRDDPAAVMTARGPIVGRPSHTAWSMAAAT
ncbi:MAG: hypothetical protein ACHQHM_06340, partial [Thermoanaerobaculales bacterium]